MAKKDYGRDINVSIELMDRIIEDLAKFQKIPIKRGLKLKGVSDDTFLQQVNKAKEHAVALYNMIEDLREQVTGGKLSKNKRFACDRVISKFLDNN